MNGGRITWILDADSSSFNSSMSNAESRAQQAGDNINKTLGDSAKQVDAAFNRLGDNLTNLGRNMSLMVSAPIVAGFGVAVKGASDFANQISQLRQVTGASAGEMTLLSDKAQALGRDTSLAGVTAANAAAAMLELSKAGLNVNDTLGASRGVLTLAKAGQMDFGQAANFTAAALNAYRLSGDKAIYVADTLANGANASQASLHDLALGMQQSSSVASLFGLSLEENVTALSLFANNGIRASDAGTSLKSMLLAIATPSKAAADKMAEIGFNAYDANGKLVGMREMSLRLAKSLEGLTDAQKQAALGTIFGSDAIRAASLLAQNAGPEWDSMAAKIARTGTAAQTAAAMQAPFSKALEGLRNNIDQLGINIGNVLMPPLTDLFKALTNGIQWFNSLGQGAQQAVVVIGILAASVGPVILGFGLMIKSIMAYREMVKDTKIILEAFKATQIGMTLASTRAAIATKVVTAAQWLWNAALTANPIGLVIVAIAALVAIIAVLWTKSETFRNFWLSMWEWMKQSMAVVGDYLSTTFGPTIETIKTTFQNVFNSIAGFIEEHKTAIMNIGIVITSLFLPKIVLIGTQFAITAAKAVAQAAIMGAAMVRQAALASAAWLRELPKVIAQFVATGASAVKNAAIASAAWVKNAAVATGMWIKNLVQLGLTFLATSAQALIAAGRVAIGWMLALGPIGLIIAAVVGLAALIIANWDAVSAVIMPIFQAIADFAVSAFNGVVSFFQGVWAGMVAGFQVAVGIFMTIAQPFIAIFNGIMFVVQALFTIWVTVWTAIGQIIWTVISTIVQIIGVVLYGTFMWLWNNVLVPTGQFFANTFNAILTTVTTVLTTVWTFITTVFTAIWSTISSVLAQVWGVISSVFTAVWNFIVGIFTQVLTFYIGVWMAIFTTVAGALAQIWGVITSVFNAVWGFISGIVSSIWNFIVNGFNNIVNGVRNAMNNVWSAVSNAFNNVVNAVRNGIQNAYNAVTGFVGRFLEAGRNIITGIVNGISGGSGAVVNKVKEIAAGALNAVKSFFGIKSPSRVMAGVGDFMMQGLANGIAKTGESAIAIAEDTSRGILNAFAPLDNKTYTVGASVEQTSPGTFGSTSSIASNASSLSQLNESMRTSTYTPPAIPDAGAYGESRIENNIGTITIANEVDAENWLQKLTRQDEVTSTGLTF